jgi:site-specific DNA-methyltransferase (adenine-specific)
MQTLASPPRNAVLQGDCINILAGFGPKSIDFVLTDPPYLVQYQSRTGLRICNDDNADWVEPAFAEIYRVLKFGSYCVSFYGWNRVDHFFAAWRKAGFRVVGHLVFPKQYASGGRLLRYSLEAAYLLAKGNVPCPAEPIADVIDWKYTGNRLHPTQKPVNSLKPLVNAFCPQGGLVLDPFCGSGSSLVAARSQGRSILGIELDPVHHATATARLAAIGQSKAA